MKRLVPLVLCTCAYFVYGCARDPEPLPVTPEDPQTGSLSMKVDGILWEPKGERGSGVNAELTTPAGQAAELYIKATSIADASSYLFDYLFIKISQPDTGTFAFGSINTLNYAYFQRNTSNIVDSYRTSTHRAGTLTITKLDTAAHTVSGAFSFKASIPFSSPEKFLFVTEGIFTDVQWK